MMEWRAVWRGVRSAEKQLSALLESGVPTAAKELTTHRHGFLVSTGQSEIGSAGGDPVLAETTFVTRPSAR